MDKSDALAAGLASIVRRKRSQAVRRTKPELQALPDGHDQSPLLSEQLSDDIAKVSIDGDGVYDGSSRKKAFNLNQCASKGSSVARADSEHACIKMKGNKRSRTSYKNGEQSGNEGVALSSHPRLVGNEVADEHKVKKLKLKVGGVTRTIQAKPSNATSGSKSSRKSAGTSDAPRPRPKLILQEDSDEDNSPPLDKNSGLQEIPRKGFSEGGSNCKEEFSDSKMVDRNASGKQPEKSERARKSKRVPKKRDLNEEFDDDDEIRYLEKLRISKVAAAGCKAAQEESGIKQRSLSRVLNGDSHENVKDSNSLMSTEDCKKAKPKRVPKDTNHEEELMSEGDPECNKKKLGKDVTDSPAESKREMTLTTRQRARLSGKGASSVSGANSIEFPDGLPPPPPRKQKEKLTEVEQQLKKAEAAERRRLQNEKAARESEAEAIRKILGQDSSRKKREDKIKKRQEELAQERTANAHIVPPNTVRYVNGPYGTTVTFSEDVGLPHIFDPKPCSYPPPREICAGPSCSNPFKYRDSKTKVPLCSLQCYKAIHEKMQGGNGSFE